MSVNHETLCSRCLKRFGRSDQGREQSYCKECHAKYMREHRKPYSKLSAEEKQKASTRSHTDMLVKRGTLTKEPCQVCQSEDRVEAHHPDYSDPRDVLWLCNSCHRRYHRLIKRASKVDWQFRNLENLKLFTGLGPKT